MSNQIIIDYLAFTVRNDSINELVGLALELHTKISNFCANNCQPLKDYIGGHMYTKGCLSFSGFRTYYGGEHTGRTMFVQISGQGCNIIDRFFEGGLQGFMIYLLKFSPKIKRIDIAGDEIGQEDESKNYCLNFDRIVKCCEKGLVTGNARSYSFVGARSLGTNNLLSGCTVYFGSRKSDAFMRIYDKKAEQRFEGVGHWIRCELELHNSISQTVYNYITASDDFKSKVCELYRGLCLRQVRFLENRELNVTRSNTASWWSDFLDGCNIGVRITQKHEDKDIHKLVAWIDHSVLGALTVVYKTFGVQFMYNRLFEFQREGRLSAEHANMILTFEKEVERLRSEVGGKHNAYIGSPGAISFGAAPPQQQCSNAEVL